MENPYKKDLNSTWMETMDKVIKYLRHAQAEFNADRQEVSGVELAYQMLQNGHISLRLYTAILPAIQDPDVDYTLKLIEDFANQ